MSTKKCACFTPSGLVYTRLETDGTIARRLDTQKVRTRRSINNDVFEPNTVDDILRENPSIGHLSFRNEARDEIETKNLTLEIDRLIEETEAFLKAYERTKDIVDHRRVKRKAQHWNHNKNKRKNEALENDSSLECKVEKNGNVNCSQTIYNDLKVWHTNRISLEDQIRTLKTKLEDLKEIKRHLKITKPIINVTVDNNLPINHTVSHHQKNNSADVNTHNEHFKKSRLHRLKTKPRGISSVESNIARPTNEYIAEGLIPSTNDGIFDVQMKNDVSTERNNDKNLINDNLVAEKQDAHASTTTEKSDYSSASVSATSDTSSTKDATFTKDYVTHYVFPETETQSKFHHSTIGMSTYEFTEKVNQLQSEDDKITTSRSSDKSDPFIEVITEEPIKPIITTEAPLLGPARLDASEFEHKNINKATHKDIIGRPIDIFQKRLHPLYIENEDKHVCYCEENR